MATAITLSGQAGINMAVNTANKYINNLLKTSSDYVVSGDTDSIYVNLSQLVKQMNIPEDKIVEFLDRFGNTKFKDALGTGVTQFNNDTNAMKHRLFFKREAIAAGMIMAKKRYLFKVYDNEGVRYADPEIKVTGLESRRSSTPEWCRKTLEGAYELFFQDDEAALHAFVKQAKKDYQELPLDKISAASSANNLAKWIGPDGNHTSGTPAHIKGAIYYNKRLKELDLEGRYPPIRSGDKIKVLTLRMPNPFKNDTVAFSNKVPPEMGIEQFVDRNLLYEKFFLEPLRRVAEVKGWSPVKINRLF